MNVAEQIRENKKYTKDMTTQDELNNLYWREAAYIREAENFSASGKFVEKSAKTLATSFATKVCK